MADEENNNVEEVTDNDAVESVTEESSSSTGGSSAGEDSSAAGDAAGADVAGGEEAEEAEALSPTEKRKRAKSRKNRRPKVTGTPEEKAEQRAKLRAKKAAKRRAYRAKQREERKAAGPKTGTPAVVKEPGVKKTQTGTVVSSKNDKTIVVAIEVAEAHRIYKKVVRHTRKLTAHDATNDANEGDVVRVIESRPLSRTKRWRLVEVVERAK